MRTKMNASHEGVVERYQRALNFVKDNSDKTLFNDSAQLKLYGLFKSVCFVIPCRYVMLTSLQIRVGEPSGPEPSAWDLVGKAKRQAWRDVDRSVSKEQLMQQYIDMIGRS